MCIYYMFKGDRRDFLHDIVPHVIFCGQHVIKSIGTGKNRFFRITKLHKWTCVDLVGKILRHNKRHKRASINDRELTSTRVNGITDMNFKK